MAKKGIIRLEPSGPAASGLSRIELDPADFQSQLPEQHWHIYFQDEALGLTVGVWTTTSMEETFGPYPGDEFMYLLEGHVTLVDGEGKETLIRPGETFVVRNAIPVSWRQEGFYRKFFMTFLSPSEPTPEIGPIEGGIKVLRETELQSKLALTSTDHFKNNEKTAPTQRTAICFTNDTGSMFAGMWESEPGEHPMSVASSHTLVTVIEGRISFNEDSGSVHDFVAGDTFFVPAGTVCAWKTNAPIRTFHCTLKPAVS